MEADQAALSNLDLKQERANFDLQQERAPDEFLAIAATLGRAYATPQTGTAFDNQDLFTHRLLSSFFLGSPDRILFMNHKKELLRGLWAGHRPLDPSGPQQGGRPLHPTREVLGHRQTQEAPPKAASHAKASAEDPAHGLGFGV